MPMFSVPDPNAIVSIVRPIGEYKKKYTPPTGRQKKGRYVDRGPIEARVGALRSVVESLFYTAGEAAVAAGALIAALEIREHYLLP